jgi:hypothetical protein
MEIFTSNHQHSTASSTLNSFINTQQLHQHSTASSTPNNFIMDDKARRASIVKKLKQYQRVKSSSLSDIEDGI